MTIFNKYYMIVIDQERRMVMARSTRYSQEFKEDTVRYWLEHPDAVWSSDINYIWTFE